MFYTGVVPEVTVVLQEQEHVIARAPVGQFLVLEQHRVRRDIRGYLNYVGINEQFNNNSISGLELLRAYRDVVELNTPRTDLAVLKPYEPEKPHQRDALLDYDDRSIVYWVHIIASAYHWSRDVILALDVDEFFAYVQEILVSRQADREWAYSLTELAYPQSSGGKYQPLPKPTWMLLPKTQKKSPPIDPTMAPQGLVLYPTANH